MGLIALLTEYVTTKDAGAILGMHRSHLPNLERRGLIASKVVGSVRKVRLYRRTDVEALLPALR